MASRCFLWVLLLGLSGPGRAWAQDVARYTLLGTVRGARGELLPGASVAVPALGTGTAADSLGRYQLSLPAGRHQLVVAFVGYQSLTRDVNLTKSQRLSFDLEENGNELAKWWWKAA